MHSSPRRPSITIRILSSAEKRRRVLRRISRTAFSAGSSPATAPPPPPAGQYTDEALADQGFEAGGIARLRETKATA